MLRKLAAMTIAVTTTAPATLAETVRVPTGPSFAAALCGFLGTTAATTMLMFLLSSV